MCQNVHRVVDLNVHMITNCGKLFSLIRDRGAILGFDLVCGTSSGIESSRDDDAVAINVVLVCFVTTILEGDGDFGASAIFK